MNAAVLWLAVFVAVMLACITGAFWLESRHDARRRTLARAPSHPAAVALQSEPCMPSLRPLTAREQAELADMDWDSIWSAIGEEGDGRG